MALRQEIRDRPGGGGGGCGEGLPTRLLGLQGRAQGTGSMARHGAESRASVPCRAEGATLVHRQHGTLHWATFQPQPLGR